MCEATTLTVAALALSAASTGYGYYQQDQAVKSENKFNSERAKEGAALARQDWELKVAAEQERQKQEQEEAALATDQVQKEAAAARSAVVISAGEANVSGFSVSALIDDFTRQESAERVIIARNREFGLAQSGLRGRSYGAQYAQNVASTRGRQQARPSPVGLALQLGAQGVSAYTSSRTN